MGGGSRALLYCTTYEYSPLGVFARPGASVGGGYSHNHYALQRVLAALDLLQKLVHHFSNCHFSLPKLGFQTIGLNLPKSFYNAFVVSLCNGICAPRTSGHWRLSQNCTGGPCTGRPGHPAIGGLALADGPGSRGFILSNGPMGGGLAKKSPGTGFCGAVCRYRVTYESAADAMLTLRFATRHQPGENPHPRGGPLLMFARPLLGVVGLLLSSPKYLLYIVPTYSYSM